jgi:septal ring factor EnvC (AmiA/AmiB activator)
MTFSRLLVSGFMLTGLLQAQSEKDLIREVQRDVAQLSNQLRQAQDARGQKDAELESLVKQAVDANAKLAANLSALQQSLTAAIAE